MPETVIAKISGDLGAPKFQLRREALIDFIIRGKLAGYAGMGEGAYQDPETHKGTKQFTFKQGQLTFYDEFAGDRVFFGIENVSVRVAGPPRGIHKSYPVWSMVYAGEALVDHPAPHAIYAFLVEALKGVTADRPYRGPPGRFRSEKFPGFLYIANYQSPDTMPSVERDEGTETIRCHGHEVYRCTFSGGLAQQDRGSITLV